MYKIIDIFEMLFNSISAYGYLVKYDLEDVEEMLDNLKWDMHPEEYNHNLKRISLLKDALNISA